MQYPEFSSSVADMKNSVADRNNAQTSCAGLFIMSHLGFDWSGVWLHVDMAAPAYVGERATGYGVALLSVLFGSASGATMLQAAAPSVASGNGYILEEGCVSLKDIYIEEMNLAPEFKTKVIYLLQEN